MVSYLEMVNYSLVALILTFTAPVAFLLVARAFGRHPREFPQIPVMMAILLMTSTFLSQLAQQSGEELALTLLNINIGLWIIAVILGISGPVVWLRARSNIHNQVSGDRVAGEKSDPAIIKDGDGFSCEPGIFLDAGEPTEWEWDGSDSVLNAIVPNNAYPEVNLSIKFTVTDNSLEVIAVGKGRFRAWYHWFLANIPIFWSTREAKAETKGLIRCDPNGENCKITGVGNKHRARDVEFSSAAIVVAKPGGDPATIELNGTGGVAFSGQQAIEGIKITGKLTLGPGEIGGGATLNFPRNADKDNEETRNVIYICKKQESVNRSH